MDQNNLYSVGISWSLLSIGIILKPTMEILFNFSNVSDIIFSVLQNIALLSTIVYTSLNIRKFFKKDKKK